MATTGKESAEFLFSKLSSEEQQAARLKFGDDLLAWEQAYWDEREKSICARAKKLEKFGIKVTAMTQHFAEIIKRRLSNGGREGTGNP